MTDKRVTAGLLLLCVIVTKGEIFDFNDKNDDEFCSVCYCSNDKTVVDCSRRGLTDIPPGIDSKVRTENIKLFYISLYH